MPVIGFMHAGSLMTTADQIEGFRKGLAELGFTVGDNVGLEYHWMEGRYDRLPAVAADLVQRRVALLAVGGGPAAALAAKAATTAIPIGGVHVTTEQVAALIFRRSVPPIRPDERRFRWVKRGRVKRRRRKRSQALAPRH
jgi:hypothetical protein